MMLTTAPSSALAGYAGPGTVTTSLGLLPAVPQRLQLHHTAGGSVAVAVLRAGPAGEESLVLVEARGTVLRQQRLLSEAVAVALDVKVILTPSCIFQ
jgi:hypothetical protein